MEKLLTQKERKKILSTFRTHPLLLTCYKSFSERSNNFDGLLAKPEDLFREVAYLLDFLLASEKVNQSTTDNYWTLLVGNIQNWKSDVTNKDKMLMAGAVFMVVRATLVQHCHARYNSDISSMIVSTLEKKLKVPDCEEHLQFLERLTENSSLLRNWINQYERNGEWLSDQIQTTITCPKDTNDDEKLDFTPTRQTFRKSARVTEIQLTLILQRLTNAKKLDPDESPDEWLKLFSGIDEDFTITWLGKPGELRDLFEMLTAPEKGTKKGYVTPRKNYLQIVCSHFTDNDGKFFTNLRRQKSIGAFTPVLNDCKLVLQHSLETMTKMMKQLIENNETALLEFETYYNSTAAKRDDGSRIRYRR